MTEKAMSTMSNEELVDKILLCCKCHNWVHSRKNTDSEFLKGGGSGGAVGQA